MPVARTFDWSEAQRLRAEGWTYAAIAHELGVSRVAIRLACDSRAREDSAARLSEWQRSGTCPDCGGQASRNGKRQHRCRACARKQMATSVRAATLRCLTCRQWLPDGAFPRNRTESQRRGRHGHCRDCTTEQKRRWRARRPALCLTCGGPCTPDSRNGKPAARCRACYCAELRKRGPAVYPV